MCGSKISIALLGIAMVVTISGQWQEVASTLLRVVQATCTQGTTWTPTPNTVNNLCMICLCTVNGTSICKIQLLFQPAACATTG
ncbi:unnamed protein product [Allacma fusca]|uniref:Secreted protein n=1 Tax=Allacma fusca TaxID=39272 RepID=A0A8J2L6M9_9HEXA|nr:unnamed protein product [Allacma fusca]